MILCDTCHCCTDVDKLTIKLLQPRGTNDEFGLDLCAKCYRAFREKLITLLQQTKKPLEKKNGITTESSIP